MTKKQKNLLVRVLAAGALLLAGALFPSGKLPPLRAALFLAAYGIVGHDILRKAYRGILHRQVFDEHFLMSVATVGAMLLGEYAEGVAVMWFYQIGELFQSCAVDRSRRSISALMDIRPDYANVESAGALARVDPDDVAIGSVIVVQPGEKVPIDGVITEGVSTLNTAALTGESLPRDVRAGDEIVSGSVNLSGLLKVRTTKAFEESTASKILELVENAGERKARSEQFITKFARVYTPAVCGGALALAVLPPLVRMLFLSLPPLWGAWVYRALTFLVISCPCAIVVSVPLSFFGGIGGASRQGVLIKGSNFMETLANVKTVAFDKTGTITHGNFAVSGVHHGTMPDEQLLEYAALAESHSSHPISRSLRRACGKALALDRVAQVREISGHGVLACVDGREIAAGNRNLMHAQGVACTDCHEPGTVVHLAVDGAYAGHILIADEIKPDAKAAVAALREAGVRRTVMLTGDTQATADAVAAAVGIDEVHAGLLPADKVAFVERLLAQKGRKDVLAFVGDGVNDAPVLARADLGIAMGAIGSDAAIEAADVVLMDDDPRKIALAIRMAQRCMRIVYENIFFALAVKFLCLALGALGIANMWLAIFADVGVMVLCVLNAIRALSAKKL